MLCTILGIDEQVFTGDIELLTAWTSDGQVSILAHHEPCLLLLESGEVTIKITGKDEPMIRFIGGGFLEVKANNEVMLLADAAENLEQWSEAEATQAKLRAEQAISEADNEESLIYAKAELAKSLARLHIVHRKHHNGGVR